MEEHQEWKAVGLQRARLAAGGHGVRGRGRKAGELDSLGAGEGRWVRRGMGEGVVCGGELDGAGQWMKGNGRAEVLLGVGCAVAVHL